MHPLRKASHEFVVSLVQLPTVVHSDHEVHVMAASTPIKLRKRNESLAAFIAVLNAVIAGVKANLATAKAIMFNNVSTTWTAIAQDFQGAVDAYNTTVAARLALKKAVAAQTLAISAARKDLKQVSAILVGMFGTAAYEMFGLPAPKARAPRTAVSKAMSTSKTKATNKAKQAALAAITPAHPEIAVAAAITAAVAPVSVPAPAPQPAAQATPKS